MHGQIAGAGLDVYEGEAEVAPELLGLENAEAFFAGKPPPNRVV